MADIPSEGSGSGIVQHGHGRRAPRHVRHQARTDHGRATGERGLPDRDRGIGQTRSASRTSTSPPMAGCASWSSARQRRGAQHAHQIWITATKRQLNHNLLLFYTGVTRKADSILSEQQSNIRSRESVLEEMKHIAHAACDKLQQGDVDAIGDLLHESWMLKKQLASKISNTDVDDLYEIARAAGATGRQDRRGRRRRLPAALLPAGPAGASALDKCTCSRNCPSIWGRTAAKSSSTTNDKGLTMMLQAIDFDKTAGVEWYFDEMKAVLDRSTARRFTRLSIRCTRRDWTANRSSSWVTAAAPRPPPTWSATWPRTRASPDWPHYKVIGLADNMAIFSAYGNDDGYDNVFRLQLANLLNPGDVVVAISTSGNSPNVLRAVELANERGATVIGMTGFGAGKLGADGRYSPARAERLHRASGRYSPDAGAPDHQGPARDDADRIRRRVTTDCEITQITQIFSSHPNLRNLRSLWILSFCSEMKQPAIILDRDGVIIENCSNYVRSWADVELFPQALAALAADPRQRVPDHTGHQPVGRRPRPHLHRDGRGHQRPAGGGHPRRRRPRRCRLHVPPRAGRRLRLPQAAARTAAAARPRNWISTSPVGDDRRRADSMFRRGRRPVFADAVLVAGRARSDQERLPAAADLAAVPRFRYPCRRVTLL